MASLASSVPTTGSGYYRFLSTRLAAFVTQNNLLTDHQRTYCKRHRCRATLDVAHAGKRHFTCELCFELLAAEQLALKHEWDRAHPMQSSGGENSIAARKARGECIICGAAELDPGSTVYCPEHLIARRMQSRKQRRMLGISNAQG